MIEDSCILQNTANYIFYQESSYTITISNCTVDSNRKYGNVITQKNSYEKFHSRIEPHVNSKLSHWIWLRRIFNCCSTDPNMSFCKGSVSLYTRNVSLSGANKWLLHIKLRVYNDIHSSKSIWRFLVWLCIFLWIKNVYTPTDLVNDVTDFTFYPSTWYAVIKVKLWR
jgi:hypothetical protein